MALRDLVATDAVIPHFDIPFRISGGAPVVNEQDSEDDVVACVEVVLRYRPGDRELLPEFGTPGYLFRNQPIQKLDIIDAITTWEPRAQVTFDEQMDAYDPLIDHIRVRVQSGEPS